MKVPEHLQKISGQGKMQTAPVKIIKGKDNPHCLKDLQISMLANLSQIMLIAQRETNKTPRHAKSKVLVTPLNSAES